MDSLPTEISLEILQQALSLPQIIHVDAYVDLTERKAYRYSSATRGEDYTVHFKANFDQYNALQLVNKRWKSLVDSLPRIEEHITPSTVVHIGNIENILHRTSCIANCWVPCHHQKYQNYHRRREYMIQTKHREIRNISFHKGNPVSTDDNVYNFLKRFPKLKKVYLLLDLTTQNDDSGVNRLPQEFQPAAKGMGLMGTGIGEGPLKEGGTMTYNEYVEMYARMHSVRKDFSINVSVEITVVRWKL